MPAVIPVGHTSAIYHLTKAWLAFEDIDFQTAYSEAKQAEALLSPTQNADFILCQLLLSKIFREGLYSYHLARDHAKKAMSLAETSKLPILLSQCYHQYARVLIDLKQNIDAELWCLKEKEILDSYSPVACELQAEWENTMAIISLFNGHKEKAMQGFEKATRTVAECEGPNTFQAGKYYDNLGVQYWQTDFKKSEKYLLRGLNINLAHPWNEYKVASSLNNLGSLYTLHRQYEKAKKVLYESLQIQKRIYGENHSETAFGHHHLAFLFEEMDNADSAIFHYNKIFQIEKNNLFSNALLATEGPQPPVYANATAWAMKSRYEVLLKQYLREHRTDFLEDGLDGLLLADSILTLTQIAYDWEEDTKALFEQVNPVYDAMIDCLYKLYQHTRDQKFAHKAFLLMEKKKYTSLTQQARRSNELKNTPSLLASRRLKKAIYLAKLELQSHRLLGLDETALTAQITQTFDSLLEVTSDLPLEANPTRDNQLINESLTLPFVIEFYDTPENIFGVSFVRDSLCDFIQVTKTDSLLVHIQQFRKICSSPNNLNAASFAKHASYLFDKLLNPFFFDGVRSAEHLTIVPDGELALLPWDALVTDESGNDYRDLSYLFHRYRISMALSLRIQTQTHHKIWPSDVRGFAFSFQQPKNALPGSDREVKVLAQLFPINELNSESITNKEEFIRKMQQANLIHLGTHGIFNPKKWWESTLVLSSFDSLKVIDLYDRHIPAELVVLSSCESAMGPHYAGEGIMGFVRAFTFAGSATVISGLWQLPDRSTSEIITEFYTHIKNGTPAIESLHEARHTYLAHADELTAHPYFWAGLCYTGHNGVIATRRWPWPYLYLVAGILLVFSGIFLVLRNKKFT